MCYVPFLSMGDTMNGNKPFWPEDVSNYQQSGPLKPMYDEKKS